MASANKKDEKAKRDRLRKAQAELAAAVKDLMPDASFAEREQAILDATNEIQKDLTRQELQETSDDLPEEVEVDGKRYKRHQSGAVQYYSLAGALLVVRDTYREVGVRNGPTIVPLDLIAGLAERATPAMARNLAHGYARHDMRTHCDVLREAHRCPPPRATAERLAKALAEAAHSHVAAVERVAFAATTVPQDASGLTIGFDRTSVPMAEELAEGANKMPPSRDKPYVRKAPAPMEVNWRMAYIGTVCIVDTEGEALATYRYAATAADDPTKLTERMAWQVRNILQQAPHLRVGIVQDGAPEMWSLMRSVLQPLRDEQLIQDWCEAIDLPHLMERLAEAFKVACGAQPSTIEYWKLQLIDSETAIDTIEQVLQRRLGALSEEDQRVLQEHLTYIENNKDRMRYTRLRDAGLPIGSGVTESTAKNVVNMRAKRSGQRWSISGLRGVLNLRALLKSDRLSQFWAVLSQRYTVSVNSLPAAA